MFIFNNFSTCFGHHYAHLQENKTYVTACGVLRCNKRGKLDRFTTQYHTKKTLQLISTFSPLVPAQHTTCSNIRLVLLKMGIMMPETCREIVKNKHLTFASRWFSLSHHN